MSLISPHCPFFHCLAALVVAPHCLANLVLCYSRTLLAITPSYSLLSCLVAPLYHALLLFALVLYYTSLSCLVDFYSCALLHLVVTSYCLAIIALPLCVVALPTLGASLPCHHTLLFYLVNCQALLPCCLAIAPCYSFFLGTSWLPSIVASLPCCSSSRLAVLPCQFVLPPHSLVEVESLEQHQKTSSNNEGFFFPKFLEFFLSLLCILFVIFSFSVVCEF